MLALTLVALRALWLAIRFSWGFGGGQVPPRDSFFFRTRMGAYAACMLFGNLFSSTAGVIGLSWIARRQITSGQYSFSVLQICLVADGFTLRPDVHRARYFCFGAESRKISHIAR